MTVTGGSSPVRILSGEPLRKRATGFRFTEGAVWHGDDHVMIFSDIPANRLYRFDPSTEKVEIYRDPSNLTNGNVFDHQHRLLSCEHGTSRVVREERDGKLNVIASHCDGLELNSPNDIIEDRQGRIYFTDPNWGRGPGVGAALGAGIPRPQEQPVEGVYRVDPRDASVVRLADDFDKPNGLCLSLDEKTLFVSDTDRGHIRHFSIVDDTLSGGEVWADVVGEGEGVPDGLKIDSQGNVYSCGPDGVHVFSPDARQIAVVRTPEVCANFNWGDPDHRTLYLCCTTSLYSCRVEIPGLPAW
jgi:gluconolactonase